MSSTGAAGCLFCGLTLPYKYFMGAVQLGCPTCGSYEVTVGAMSRLRSDPAMKAAVRVEIRKQLDCGVERPRINLDDLEELKGR